MTKLEKLYLDYSLYSELERKTLMRTLKIVDKRLYYKLQGKIFVGIQQNLYKNIAQMLVDDCMKYFNKFSIRLADILVDEMQFMNIPDDIKRANQARIKALNFGGEE